MVWFQCEDCGENLKKPKLAGHFRSCYASKVRARRPPLCSPVPVPFVDRPLAPQLTSG